LKLWSSVLPKWRTGLKSWKKRMRTCKPMSSVFPGGNLFDSNFNTHSLPLCIGRVSISATVSLEPTTITENGGSQKEIEILQAQLERIESQLEKAREAAVLDRQACRTAQTDLYKVCIFYLFSASCLIVAHTARTIILF
jgi:hypothetical protein